MITSIRRLRLTFSRQQPPQQAPLETGGDPRVPEVEFAAYAEDCRLSGRIALAAERLSDMLNEHDEIVLVDVLVEGLADGRVFEVPEFTVRRDELLVVEATGPRGNVARRQRMRPYPIASHLGPYEVRGYVHVTPGADPINAIRRRRPMIPLTDAAIEYVSAGVRQRRGVATLVFNRDCMDWVANATDDEMLLPDLPALQGGPLLKDFTGELMTWAGESR